MLKESVSPMNLLHAIERFHQIDPYWHTWKTPPLYISSMALKLRINTGISLQPLPPNPPQIKPPWNDVHKYRKYAKRFVPHNIDPLLPREHLFIPGCNDNPADKTIGHFYTRLCTQNLLTEHDTPNVLQKPLESTKNNTKITFNRETFGQVWKTGMLCRMGPL